MSLVREVERLEPEASATAAVPLKKSANATAVATFQAFI